MATFSLGAGRLNHVSRRGDEFSALIDFSNDLTGATFAGEVYSLVDQAAVLTPTLEAIDLPAGKVNMSWVESATSSLATGTYGIRVWWTADGDVKRTVLEGFLELRP